MNWLSARWAEKSTKRSLPLLACGVTAIIYAIINHEPSSAITGVGISIYATLNAATPET